MRKPKIVLKQKDFEFIEKFMLKEKIKEGRGIKTMLGIFLNEYKKSKKRLFLP